MLAVLQMNLCWNLSLVQTLALLLSVKLAWPPELKALMLKLSVINFNLELVCGILYLSTSLFTCLLACPSNSNFGVRCCDSSGLTRMLGPVRCPEENSPYNHDAVHVHGTGCILCVAFIFKNWCIRHGRNVKLTRLLI